MWADLRYVAEQNRFGFIKKQDHQSKNSSVFNLGVFTEMQSRMEFPDLT